MNGNYVFNGSSMKMKCSDIRGGCVSPTVGLNQSCGTNSIRLLIPSFFNGDVFVGCVCSDKQVEQLFPAENHLTSLSLSLNASSVPLCNSNHLIWLMTDLVTDLTPKPHSPPM